MTRAVAPLTAHPAKYSEPIMDVIGRRIAERARAMPNRPMYVLDPFAGVGRVHRWCRPGYVETTGIEIEPEWAACHERTICADSLEWMRERTATRWRGAPPEGHLFDVVVSSPTYGNRFADSYDAKDASKRYGYTFSLGRTPATGSSSTMPWGERYWDFHALALRRIFDVLLPGGLLLWNVSNFIKAKAEVHAVEWHRGAAYGAGFVQQARAINIQTSRMGNGENGKARADGEWLLRMTKPDPS